MSLGFEIKDIIDIALVGFLLYQIFRLVRGTSAANVFVGIIAFVLCWFLVSVVLKMKLLGAIMNTVMSVGAIALFIIFQQEIRRFFSMIGNEKNWAIFRWVTKRMASNNQIKDFTVVQLVMACTHMSKNKCGALIVIEKNADLSAIYSLGEQIDGKVNARLIESLFFKNSPLHDGAMIISGERIIAASCILPISRNQTIHKSLGLRHRAALGIAEKTDALAIVVSEETGRMSIAKNGNLRLDISPKELGKVLSGED